MMRLTALIPLMILAACSDSAEADEQAKTADKAGLKLAAGQWETTTEIMKVTSKDNGTPVLKEATRTVVSHCVGEGEGKRPAPVVLAGLEGGECSYDNIYLARGRLTAAMSCTQPGLSGTVLISSEGSYTADSFETNADIQTSLSTDGDATATAKITGRRVGACAAPAAETAS